MVRSHRFVLAQFVWTILLSGNTSRLQAQEVAPTAVSEAVPLRSSAVSPEETATASNTKIVFLTSVRDDDESKRARAIIDRIANLTEIKVTGWNNVEHGPDERLLSFIVTPTVTPERLASLIEGVKNLGLPEVHTILRLDINVQNTITIEHPGQLDDPSLKRLWDYLKSQHDFELRAPAGRVIKPLLAADQTSPSTIVQENVVQHSKEGNAQFWKQKEVTAPPSAPAANVRVFALNNSRAADVAKIVEQLHNGALSVAVDERTNSLIVRGPDDIAKEFQALWMRLDDAGKTKSMYFPDASTPEALDLNRGSLNGLQFRGVSGYDTDVFSLYMGITGPSSRELRQQYDALEVQAKSLSEQLRKPLSDPATGEKLKSQLRDTVQKVFDTRQKLQRAELAEFAKRLKGIEQSIEMREKIGQQIIERRIQELLDPNLKWESPKAK